jgi:hypothetical protein
MTNQDSVDIVELVSASLHDLNMRLASMLPSEAGFDDLEHKRDELEVKFKRLVRGFFADNTRRFVRADDALVAVNNRMRSAIRSLQNLQDTIDSINGLIGALDQFISTVFPVAA